MIRIFINEKECLVPENITILQACELNNIKIPRFCYHEKLSIAGNCRMCLVEVIKSLKPIASCALNVSKDISIFTDTLLVKKAREGVLEFLLANHPLDCPICDQGGECDLQDQAYIFGSDRGRFYEYKRAVEDKNCGPLIKTVMTRCIHCTRCIRFINEVAGTQEFGVTGRGNHMEIGTYIEKNLYSELSGNIIDLCPVGALTSKPYAFTSRSWELKSTESIDILDALGSNIRVDTRGNEIMRILPRINENINEEWITDKIRFSYDGLQRQRLYSPLLKIKNNKLIEVSWKKSFDEISFYFYCMHFKINNLNLKFNYKNNSNNILKTYIGNLIDLETLLIIKKFNHNLGNSLFYNSFYNYFNNDFVFNYIFNNEFLVKQKNINYFNETDLILLIGSNLRLEAPLLNSKIRKLINEKNIKIINFGINFNSFYKKKNLSYNINLLIKFLEGKHKLCQEFIKASKPLIIFGINSLINKSQKLIIEGIKILIKNTNILNINENWYGINFLHLNLTSINYSFLGIRTQEINKNKIKINNKIYKKKNRITYLLSCDELAFSLKFKENNLIIYQGSFGDINASIADIILPSTIFIEKESNYINIQGKKQKTKFVINSPINTREDWKILKVLLEIINKNLIYPSINIKNNLINYNTKEDIENNLNKLLYGEYNNKLKENINLIYSIYNKTVKNNMKINNIFLNSFISNYYFTDSISRSSKIMALCANLLLKNLNNFKK